MKLLHVERKNLNVDFWINPHHIESIEWMNRRDMENTAVGLKIFRITLTNGTTIEDVVQFRDDEISATSHL